MQFAVFILSKTVGEIGQFYERTLFLNIQRRRSELKISILIFSPGQIWVPHCTKKVMCGFW